MVDPGADNGHAVAAFTLGDRLRTWRNRVIADPAFQRWAAAFPLTRPIARRRSRALFDLTAGFVYSQIAFACVQSGLLARLSTGPATADSLAAGLDLDPAQADRLLRAAVALKLAERWSDDRYGLGEEGAALLGAPGVTAMIEHHALLYADLTDPLGLLRRNGGGGALAGYWPYAEERTVPPAPDAVAAYSTLMAASQTMVAEQVLAACSLGRHRRLLDVGGGEGAFLRAVAARHPELGLGLFDLPAVAARAQARFEIEGLEVAVTGGSFFNDPLPRGFDVVSLVRVLHDHDDAPALALLRAIRASMEPGTTLIVAEPMAEAAGAERVGDAYFGFYLLAMGSGRPRPVADIRALLAKAGFSMSRQFGTAMPIITQLIVARA